MAGLGCGLAPTAVIMASKLERLQPLSKKRYISVQTTTVWSMF
jgi:hypothetical protein